jgi:CRISPR system Cascade subunit CasA
VDLTREYLGRLEEVAHTADRLVEAGELKPTEARLLRIETARRRGDLQRLEGELEIRRRDVFALLGLSPDAPVELRGRMSVPEIVVADESREDWLLRRHPRIRRVRAEYRSAEERLRLEIRRQYPDMAIGPSFSLEEGFSRLGLGLARPLPHGNRNRRGIAEATAGREAARVRAEAETERLLGDLGLAEARLESARRQRGYLVAQVAPLVDRQVSETRTLLDLGEVDVLVLRDALSTSLETKLEIVEATRAESVAANAVYSLLSPRWAVADEADGKDDAR